MNKLVVLWKTDNEIDIEQMVIPYIHNSKIRGWWKEVEVIIWGASQKVIAENEVFKADIEAMIHDGVKVLACKGCSDNLCVTDSLSTIGINIIYSGELLI